MPSVHPVGQLSIVRLEQSWAFAACWVAAGLLLYMVGSPPTGPAVFPDEVCRLGWARLLAGTGPHYEMSQGAYCQPYYALLIAPFQRLTDDPAMVHRAIFAINSGFAAACLPLAVRLGIRHFELGTGLAWIAGLAILAYPSLTLYSHHALPETILFPGVLLAFALWCNWVDRPDWKRFAVLLTMGIALYALHRKMLVVPLALTGGAIVGYWFNKTADYRFRALLTALALVSAFMLDELVKKMARVGGFDGADAGALYKLVRLTSLEHLENVVGNAAGVLVYGSLVTGGCIFLVLGGGLDSIRRVAGEGVGTLDLFAKKSVFASGMIVLLVAVTATYLGGSARFDLLFYGRHVDSTLGVALLPAIAMIARGRANGSVLRWTIALAVSGFLILAAFMPAPPWADFSRIHVIGAGTVMEWMYEAGDRWTLLGYCAAILALAVTVYLARMPGLYRFTALVPFAIVTITTHLTTQPFAGVPIEEAIPEPAANILREANPCHVHYDSRGGGRLRVHQYSRLQYYFPNCSIEVVPYDQPLPPDSLVILTRQLANCGPKTQCHDLHPDLVLKRTAGE